jgi:hypothetical protein
VECEPYVIYGRGDQKKDSYHSCGEDFGGMKEGLYVEKIYIMECCGTWCVFFQIYYFYFVFIFLLK